MGFLFQHEADEEVARQHIHGYLFESRIKRATLSEQIAAKLNITGNKDFFTLDKCSKKDRRPLDMSGAYCYGSKWDTIAPSYLKNISPDLLDELRSYSRSRAPNSNASSCLIVDSNTVIVNKKNTKPTQYQHVQTCVTMILTNSPEIVKMRFDDSKEIIFDQTFAYFRAQEMFMGKYKQLDFLDMVMLKLGVTEYKDALFADFCARNKFARIV